MQNQKKLNKQQLEAIEHQEGPLLIIAGAGTGKTAVITERIKWLISKKLVKPAEILALTFTDKAAREMEERVDMALPFGVTQLWISTFHKFGDRILREEALETGLDPGYKLMGSAESIIFFRKNLFRFDLNYFRPLGNPKKFIEGMLQHFDRLKDEDVTPQDYLAYAKNLEDKFKIQKFRIEKEDIDKTLELAHAYRRYEELKVKEGVMDFGDLISNTLKLFRERKNILRQYQKQFKHILIDEFQDTNFAQNELAILLAGSKKNITAVGDDNQAIYRWRGAAVSNIIQFRQRFPETKLAVLTGNYRSTGEILDSSYRLIQFNNPDTLEYKEKINKKLTSERKIEGEKVEFIYTERVEDEAQEVVKRIKSLFGKSFRHPDRSRLGGRVEGSSTFRKLEDSSTEFTLSEVEGLGMTTFQTGSKNENEKKYTWKDFAILVRANSQADVFTRALHRLGVPYQFLGPGKLFAQKEVKDLISYLKFLDDFTDSVAFFRVLSMPIFDLFPRDLMAINNFARRVGISIFEAVETVEAYHINNLDHWSRKKNYRNYLPFLSGKTKEALGKLLKMINRHLSLVKSETAGQILYFFLEDTGLLRKMTEYKTVKEEREINNISKFFDKLKTYETEHEDASVPAVVDFIDMSMELGESPLAQGYDWTQNDAVNILTVHSAKGLEFGVVFLVNLVTGRFPTYSRREKIPIPEELIKEILPEGDYHLEEERRLFYVGMTRARDRLFFTAANYYGEGKRERKISPFIEEALGEEIVTIKPFGSANTEQGRSAQGKQLTLLEWGKQEELPERVIRQPIYYLSYSQINIFTTCPLQYKYRYIIKIPVPPSAAGSFGTSMHLTLQRFYEKVKKGEKPAKDSLLSILDEVWLPVGYGTREYEEKMKNRGFMMLSDFYEKSYNPDIIPKDLEQFFKIKLTASLKIGGKIDRVDEISGGKLEIIDYKTGRRPTEKEIKENLQMTVYALAATDAGIYGRKPEEVILSFYFFDTQEKVSSTRTGEQLNKAKKKLLEKAREIEESNFEPKAGPGCDFCDFRLICEAWQ